MAKKKKKTGYVPNAFNASDFIKRKKKKKNLTIDRSVLASIYT